MGVGQELALLSIFSALYLVPFFHILEKHFKNLKLQISMLSFVDDSLFIAQSKSLQLSNSCLFYSYNVTSILLSKFSLSAEHSKTEVFHFTRLQGTFNSPPLGLSTISGPILYPKESWRYLGFIFNKKLLFH